jgi:hypothetical protein
LATEPRIDRIERTTTNHVVIHFVTEPGRIYELQRLDNLACQTNSAGPSTVLCSSNGVPAGAWSNVFVVPPLPLPNRYSILDAATNRHRFYRLRVMP